MPPPTPNALKLPSHLAILNPSQLDMLFPSTNKHSTQLLLELIDMFAKENGEHLEQWKKICETHNETELSKEAHYLAGSSLNLGLQRLGTLCQNIEAAIKNKSFNEFNSCYAVVKNEFNAGTQALRNYTKQKQEGYAPS